MAKRPGTPHDFTVIARRVVEQAIGEKLSGDPLDTASKNPKRVAAGKMGGPARAAKLSPVQRKLIAVRAAEKRWGKPTITKKS